MRGKIWIMSRFNVSVSSRFEELWRYNLVLVCELCSADGERIEFYSKESCVAPVGSNLVVPPNDYDSKRELSCECGEGDHLNILLYVIPNTLPVSNDIYNTKPFPLSMKVKCDGDIILNQVFSINQWSGENITLNRVGQASKI